MHAILDAILKLSMQIFIIPEMYTSMYYIDFLLSGNIFLMLCLLSYNVN